jgi:hypothetical protein
MCRELDQHRPPSQHSLQPARGIGQWASILLATMVAAPEDKPVRRLLLATVEMCDAIVCRLDSDPVDDRTQQRYVDALAEWTAVRREVLACRCRPRT